MRKTLIAIATFATALAAPAAAHEAFDDVTIEVQVSDLDLARAADRERLEDRIQTTIRQACRTGGRDLASRDVEAACRASLADSIAPRVELAIAQARSVQLATLNPNPDA